MYINQSNRKALRWTILIKQKKMFCGETCIKNTNLYTLYFYGSFDYKNTNLYNRKMVLTKKIIQGMLNIFYILSEKIDFLAGGARAHPP